MLTRPMPIHSLRVSFAMGCLLALRRLKRGRRAGALAILALVLHVTRACLNVGCTGDLNDGSWGHGAVMILAIAELLTAADLDTIGAQLAGARFSEGSATAGWSARLVKNNLQAGEGPELDSVRELIRRGPPGPQA